MVVYLDSREFVEWVRKRSSGTPEDAKTLLQDWSSTWPEIAACFSTPNSEELKGGKKEG